jgi:hypothetical protein
MWATVRAMLDGKYTDREAAAMLAEESRKPHGPLVQLGISVKAPDRELVGVGAK